MIHARLVRNMVSNPRVALVLFQDAKLIRVFPYVLVGVER